jgi:hypothetical protein
MLTIFLYSETKTFRLANFLVEKQTLAMVASVFFSLQESSPNKTYCLRMLKIINIITRAEHIQEKPHSARTSVVDAIITFRVLNVSIETCTD